MKIFSLRLKTELFNQFCWWQEGFIATSRHNAGPPMLRRPAWSFASEALSLTHCQATGLRTKWIDASIRINALKTGFGKPSVLLKSGFSIDSMQVKLRNERKIRSIRNWEMNDEWSVTERSTGYLLFTSVVVHATNKHRLHSDRGCTTFDSFPLIFLSLSKIKTSNNETESICFIITSKSSQALFRCSITHSRSFDERTLEHGAPTMIQCPQHSHSQRWWCGAMDSSSSPPALIQGLLLDCMRWLQGSTIWQDHPSVPKEIRRPHQTNCTRGSQWKHCLKRENGRTRSIRACWLFLLFCVCLYDRRKLPTGQQNKEKQEVIICKRNQRVFFPSELWQRRRSQSFWLKPKIDVTDGRGELERPCDHWVQLSPEIDPVFESDRLWCRPSFLDDFERTFFLFNEVLKCRSYLSNIVRYASVIEWHFKLKLHSRIIARLASCAVNDFTALCCKAEVLHWFSNYLSRFRSFDEMSKYGKQLDESLLPCHSFFVFDLIFSHSLK